MADDMFGEPAETVAGKGGSGVNRGAVAGFCVLAAGILGWGVYATLTSSTRPANAKVEETFGTARGQAIDAIAPKAAKKDDRLIAMTPPAAVPVAVAPPVVIVPPADDSAARARAEEERRKAGEARRLAEEERARLAAGKAKADEAERQRQARLRSGMLVVDGNAGGDGTAVAGGSGAGAGGAVRLAGRQEDNPDKKFFDNAASGDVEIARAARNNRIDALVPQGAMIRGVLETAIQSDLPGMVRAVTSEDVYSFDGRRVLIPKGTVLTGEYKSGLSRGQTRVLIVWTRMLRSDGVSLALGSYGTDSLGRSGLQGEVDSHNFERFGSAIVLSIVGGASSFLAGLNVTGSATATTGSSQPAGRQAQSQAQQTVSQTMADLAKEALKDSIGIPPTVNIDQGARIIVFVRRDLDFSSLYPDPVKEALDELRATGSGSARARRMGSPAGLSATGVFTAPLLARKP